MSRIELEHITKTFGAVTAADDVSFVAPEGKLLVLLGPSGCGKSTVLRLIAGLEDVSAGTIRIGGRDVTHTPPSQRKISMVFQSYALFPHLSVAENIVFGLRVRKVPRSERDARLQRTAELLGLSELLHRKPAQLSGGQRQRVALGRAIVAELHVCLMDEPLSNLDAQLRHEMRIEIRSLQQRLGMTMIYVTHDQVEAMSMADHVILLVRGRIEQSAAPADLYRQPLTVFAARFIGTPPMNILDLSQGLPEAALEQLGVDERARRATHKVLVGVRPEHMRLADQSALRAEVQAVEYLGADTILTCRLDGQSFAVRTEERAVVSPGDRVGVTWAPQRVHLFNAETGWRLDVDAREPAPSVRARA
ncbi:MAG TPA: ABC transporter ATP-binding protein [bacterium]|nr:ABC transporter ATP-binding protein [bacterium]